MKNIPIKIISIFALQLNSCQVLLYNWTVVENGAMSSSYSKLRIVFSKHERLEDAMKDFIVLKEKSID